MSKGYWAVKLMLALIIAYIITGITTIIAAFVAYKLSLSEELVNVISKAIYIISTFFGGYYYSHHMKQKRLIFGGLLGIIYFLVILVVHVVVTKNGIVPSNGMGTSFALCMIGGMVGGFLG